MWPHVAQVKRLSGSGLTAFIQNSDHYLIDTASSFKIGFQASFDSACLHFTPFPGFAFHSSPVIVIVKIHFII